MRLSFAIASPISAPPQNDVKIAPGKLFFSKTPATSFVIAMVIKGVVGAPFLQSMPVFKHQGCKLTCGREPKFCLKQITLSKEDTTY